MIVIAVWHCAQREKMGGATSKDIVPAVTVADTYGSVALVSAVWVLFAYSQMPVGPVVREHGGPTLNTLEPSLAVPHTDWPIKHDEAHPPVPSSQSDMIGRSPGHVRWGNRIFGNLNEQSVLFMVSMWLYAVFINAEVTCLSTLRSQPGASLAKSVHAAQLTAPRSPAGCCAQWLGLPRIPHAVPHTVAPEGRRGRPAFPAHLRLHVQRIWRQRVAHGQHRRQVWSRSRPPGRLHGVHGCRLPRGYCRVLPLRDESGPGAVHRVHALLCRATEGQIEKVAKQSN